jgi:hypothetical protein
VKEIAAIRTNPGLLAGGFPAPSMHCHFGVQGTITSRDVLLHSLTILRLWGPAFYVRCLKAIASGRTCTFLDVLARRE